MNDLIDQHTRGPWHRDGFDLSSIIRLQFPVGHPDCKHIGGTYEKIAHCDGDNWDANARLIAAAPDLLNALTVLADHCDKAGIPVHAARAAIAKARGAV